MSPSQASVCTSSNAQRSLTWAFDQREPDEGKVLFLPDQHLGRNTAVLELGLSLDDCVVIDTHKPDFGVTDEQLKAAKMLLWRGHCSVHGRFSAKCVDDVRDRIPGVNVLVHPECTYDVVTKADYVGSTEYIISMIAAAPAGSAWAVGTELNLVKRLAEEHPDKTVVFLDDTVCFCATMNRIDLPHLVWALENLVEGTVVNRIEVDEYVTHWARVALDRMLADAGYATRDATDILVAPCAAISRPCTSSSSALTIFEARSPLSPGPASNPVWPGMIISGMPPISNATTGVPHAIDSRRTFAQPSRLEASTNTSTAA